MKTTKQTCYHCGDYCDIIIELDDKHFCCHGCKTVYEIFTENNLAAYYDYAKSPGASPKAAHKKFDYLENDKIIEKLITFKDGDVSSIQFHIPHIHCSSCIWILEHLHKLHTGIINGQVNFLKKTVRITFNIEQISVKALVLLLNNIGYEPLITLDDYDKKTTRTKNTLYYKLGVAGFAFGNVMFLSFPEYFEHQEFWLERYKYLFRWLMLFFSIPAVFYAGSDYLVAAFKGIKAKSLNIDVPIALGILVLFIRSASEVVLDLGSGFFDSLTGLIFFLLVGKFFQQKTYSFLSFERDYKSYFPISITRIRSKNEEENIPIYDITINDRLLIRNEEIIPTDSILESNKALVDYSFVTGESKPVTKKYGEKVFAGGKLLSGVVEVKAIKEVTQSYLIDLWSNETIGFYKKTPFKNITDTISKRFTQVVLAIAMLSTLFWLVYNANEAINVFTSVLIIACPCAIALAAPFTLGNILRMYGYHKLYLKDANIIEKMATIDTIIFDKTGTITASSDQNITYEGVTLTAAEKTFLKSTLRSSNHPLSRQLYHFLKTNDIYTIDSYKEHLGLGIEGVYKANKIKIGSSKFLLQKENDPKTSVGVSTNDEYKGRFVFENTYRKGLTTLSEKLAKNYRLIILSGDNDSEREKLTYMLPETTAMYFNQSPKDKRYFVKNLQEKGHRVMMIGDGLNDAGALAQSDVGIAISEDVNVFSPACDGILDAGNFTAIHNYLKLSKKAVQIIKWSFILSLLYNVIGLSFAIAAKLSPVVAAILMPLSSISIVFFTTLVSNYYGRKLS